MGEKVAFLSQLLCHRQIVLDAVRQANVSFPNVRGNTDNLVEERLSFELMKPDMKLTLTINSPRPKLSP